MKQPGESSAGRSASPGGDLPLLMVYDRFREILSLNESVHRLLADLEEQVAGRKTSDLAVVVQRIRRGFLEALIMVKDLNQIAEGRYGDLFDVLDGLNRHFEAEVSSMVLPAAAEIVVPLSGLRAADAPAVGVKMAHLGEVRNFLGLPVPDGFAITTTAFRMFLSENGLWQRANQLGRLVERGAGAVAEASLEVREAVLRAPVPAALAEEMLAAYDRLAAGRPLRVAVRSSAVGEDRAASHAGQYSSCLHVERDGLLDAYREVLASAFRPEVLAYRVLRGLAESDDAMAVGCLEMVAPRASGVLFSRDFRDLGADRVQVGFTRGIADGLVKGERSAEERIFGPGDLDAVPAGGLEAGDLDRLFALGRGLERHFGRPQDVEWAIDADGRLLVLQARQMVETRPTARLAAPPPGGIEPIIAGGHTACPGAGAGPVVLILDPAVLDGFPAAAVAVVPFASPLLSVIMARAAAIVTEVGSPTGHMAILARELGVPSIVGLSGAVTALKPGQVITVDADDCRVLPGALPTVKPRSTGSPAATAGVSEEVRRLVRLVTPLRLIDPLAPEFRPDGCRSLHDLTRFVHERLYDAMFRFGERASRGGVRSFVLAADLPFRVRVFDLGGGVREGAASGGRLATGGIACFPLRALIEGLGDPRIDWKKPRRVSAGGFLSVLGESLVAPPPESTDLGAESFAVVSDRYVNLSVKAGYHFSTVDAFCDENPRSNYIGLRYFGGGAGEQRRRRRLRFLSQVLLASGFETRTEGDMLIGRIEKLGPPDAAGKLRDLGRLLLCARQLDMLMDSDESPAQFAEAFLAGRWAEF